jgi:hypothetical protein
VLPLAHPAATVEHSWPRLLLQVPVASQVPAHRPFGSSMLTAATQACAAEHVLHAPAQSALLQQAPAAMQVVVVPTVQACVGLGQA